MFEPGNPTIVNNYGYVLDQMNRNEEAFVWYLRRYNFLEQSASTTQFGRCTCGAVEIKRLLFMSAIWN